MCQGRGRGRTPWPPMTGPWQFACNSGPANCQKSIPSPHPKVPSFITTARITCQQPPWTGVVCIRLHCGNAYWPALRLSCPFLCFTIRACSSLLVYSQAARNQRPCRNNRRRCCSHFQSFTTVLAGGTIRAWERRGVPAPTHRRAYSPNHLGCIQRFHFVFEDGECAVPTHHGAEQLPSIERKT